MPSYDFRCKDCQTEFVLTYKTLKAYEEALKACPNCQSDALSRVIKRVAIRAGSRDYGKMSSNDMLNVFSSGDSRAVGEMFQQVAGTNPDMATEYHDATQRLLRGDSMDSVEKGLQERNAESTSKPSSPATPKVKKAKKPKKG